ncbi:hypothetical protein [Salibacterium lacus]|uniref:Uncharacterized protein n=1 Tax=Salibacterium lacus TaxID=1898109 RepID=A0ABW5T1R7_9BACI
MNLTEHGDIAKTKTYKAELQKSEEVAEWGEHAPSTRGVSLPAYFDINDADLRRQFKQKMKAICHKEGFDTVVLHEITHTEYLIEIQEEGDETNG